MVSDFINKLAAECETRGQNLERVELLFDSAYGKKNVITVANSVGMRVITKAENTTKYEFEGEYLKPREIIEKVKERWWKRYPKGRYYQRLLVNHSAYGQVLLVVRRRRLKNGEFAYDALLCNKVFYRADRVDWKYKNRWEIEMHFKYYKQYLRLGKQSYRKINAIKSHLYCVALLGLIIALYRQQTPRKISFRKAVKSIAKRLQI